MEMAMKWSWWIRGHEMLLEMHLELMSISGDEN